MTIEPTTVAIVDPVSLGSRYGREIRAMGLRSVAVMTRPDFPPYFAKTFDAADFDAVYVAGTFEDTVTYLRAQQISALIPGHHSGLGLTDRLTTVLGLRGNGLAHSEARHHKRRMKERLQELDIPCAAFLESDKIETLLGWSQAQGYPVILKPTDSSGSSHVLCCRTALELRSAFTTITETPCIFGNRYQSALVEEYLDGEEYFLNLLHNGQEEGMLISAARYEKLQRDGHASVYRNIWSLPLDDPAICEALPYIQDVNRALDIRYGINDTEFKMTLHGPRVIEVNNRLPGANTPYLIERCSGFNCYQENVRIFTNQRRLRTVDIHYDRHYVTCCLINDTPGSVESIQGFEAVQQLPSYDAAKFYVSAGDFCAKTSDLVSTWGLVFLIHRDREQLALDAEIVHNTLCLEVLPCALQRES